MATPAMLVLRRFGCEQEACSAGEGKKGLSEPEFWSWNGLYPPPPPKSIGMYESGESAAVWLLSWLFECFICMGEQLASRCRRRLQPPPLVAFAMAAAASGVEPVRECLERGECRADGGLAIPVASLSERPRPLEWTLFLCLNFSSQAALLALTWHSEMPRLVANNRALSRIMVSVKVMPCFRVFFAHTDSARSMSGNLPLLRLMGDLLPSSGNRYFSFCRRTFDTVLIS